MKSLSTDLCTRYQQARSRIFSRMCREERLWKVAQKRVKASYERAWERACVEACAELNLTQEDRAILELEVVGVRVPEATPPPHAYRPQQVIEEPPVLHRGLGHRHELT